MFSPLLTLVADAYPLICPTASFPPVPKIRQSLVPFCWFSMTIGLLAGGSMVRGSSRPTASADRAAGICAPGSTTLEIDERMLETDVRAFGSDARALETDELTFGKGERAGSARTYGNAPEGCAALNTRSGELNEKI